ncbi:fucose-specific lectin [Apiospora rasikravindrae]|uniref:Fucose-specific lectin n=1 Tax=Apiospora rasikravindrae TaxID=990691 RepID=A0ABR1TAT2_9PEZI
MTGCPTSVRSGLAPTAVSWGYPHLKVFALTTNATEAVYRKMRTSDATSETEFLPPGRAMSLVGGVVDTATAPYIAVTLRKSFDRVQNEAYNRTEVHIYNSTALVGVYKFHNNKATQWTPWWLDERQSDPDAWETTAGPLFERPDFGPIRKDP